MPWQAGIVGIGYNPTLTGREITSFDDLLDPAFAGNVGLFSEMRDTMCLTILSLGMECADATIEDATAARDKMLAAQQAGQNSSSSATTTTTRSRRQHRAHHGMVGRHHAR